MSAKYSAPPSAAAARSRNPASLSVAREAQAAINAEAARKAEARAPGIALADAEFAAAMDPYLRSDPIARLGYDRGATIGRMRNTFLPGTDPNLPNVYGAIAPNRFQSYVYSPEVQTDVIQYGVNRNHPAIVAHEMRHRGMRMLDSAYPEYNAEDMWMPPSLMSESIAEGFNEIGDLPFKDIAFNYPAGSTLDVAPTIGAGIQFQPHLPETTDYYGMYETAMQRALDELAARGETPQVAPRMAAPAPAPAPNPEQGLLSRLFDYLAGAGNGQR